MIRNKKCFDNSSGYYLVHPNIFRLVTSKHSLYYKNNGRIEAVGDFVKESIETSEITKYSNKHKLVEWFQNSLV